MENLITTTLTTTTLVALGDSFPGPGSKKIVLEQPGEKRNYSVHKVSIGKSLTVIFLLRLYVQRWQSTMSKLDITTA